MFANKVCWIVGASSGIGKELAMQLNAAGAVTILSSSDESKLSKVQESLPNKANSFVLKVDLMDQSNFPDLAKTIVEKYGHIDYLFNNGGVSQRGEASETSIDVDRKIMEINYFGNIALTKAVLPYMQEKKSGHIVVTSSLSGKFGFFLRSAYSASKHALQGFYESLLLEEEKNNLKVTLAYPGKINTDISKSALRADGSQHGEMDHNQATGMSVEECVRQLLKAVRKNKKSVMIGGKEMVAVKLKRYFPSLFWRVIRKQSAT